MLWRTLSNKCLRIGENCVVSCNTWCCRLRQWCSRIHKGWCLQDLLFRKLSLSTLTTTMLSITRLCYRSWRNLTAHLKILLKSQFQFVLWRISQMPLSTPYRYIWMGCISCATLRPVSVRWLHFRVKKKYIKFAFDYVSGANISTGNSAKVISFPWIPFNRPPPLTHTHFPRICALLGL